MAPRGGQEARPPPARRAARPVQLPRRRAGPAFWHPKGQRICGRSKASMRELQERRGYQEISTPSWSAKRLWKQSGHWDLYHDNMFMVESEEQTSPQADELPGVHVHLSLRQALLSRPAAALQRVRPAASQRALGDAHGLPRVRQFIQDDAHIYVRPDQLPDEIEALLGEVHEAYGGSGSSRVRLRTKPDKAIGDPALWERAESSSRRPSTGPNHATSVKPRTARSTRPRSTSTSTTRSAASGSWRRSSSTSDAARAVRPEVRRRDGQPQRPIASTAPSTARWSASSGSWSSTSPARFRSGSRRCRRS